jgi:hypothetical protein
LQVDLLAEREMTVVLQLLQDIARHLDVHTSVTAEQLRDLAKKTDLHSLTDRLEEFADDHRVFNLEECVKDFSSSGPRAPTSAGSARVAANLSALTRRCAVLSADHLHSAVTRRCGVSRDRLLWAATFASMMPRKLQSKKPQELPEKRVGK